MDLSRTIAAVMGIDPAANAIQCDGTWTTWGQVVAMTDELDGLLAAAGVPAEAPVGIVLRNRTAHAAAILGLLAGRRCVVAIRTLQPDADLALDLENLRLAAVIAAQDDWERPGVAAACARVGGIGIAIGPGTSVSTWHGLADIGPGPFHESQTGVAVRILTSGTTGAPKRTSLRYEAFESAMEGLRSYSSARHDAVPDSLGTGVVIVALPLSHISGFWGVVQAAANARSIALLERFEPHHWAALVREHEPTVINLPPAPMRMVLDADIPPTDLGSLKAVLTGSARLPPEQADEFTERYGIPTLAMYGATEFAGAVAAWNMPDYRRYWREKRGSVGRAYARTSLRIVDPESGEPLPIGQIGLLEVISPQVVGPRRGEWVRTTDLGRLDDDGFLWIEGRADEMIIRGGFKVEPIRVERVLLEHPAVRQAAVTGVPDHRLGEVPVAAVVGDDERLDPIELTQWCRERLAPYEVPVRIRIMRELPLTGPLKVNKGALRELLATE